MRTFSFRQPCYLIEQEECISFNNELYIIFLFFFFFISSTRLISDFDSRRFLRWLEEFFENRDLCSCCLVIVYFDLALTIAISINCTKEFYSLRYIFLNKYWQSSNICFFIILNFIKNTWRKKFSLNRINNIHLFCNYFFLYYRLLFIIIFVQSL